MPSLKQEMRDKYETHSSMAFYENNSGFEEGLLEKIINLAYAGLAPYSSLKWDITAVKSPVLLHKLSKAADDRRILECAVSLIVCESMQIEEGMADFANGRIRTGENTADLANEPAVGNMEGYGYPDNSRTKQQELDLLSLSVGYAAKYYCIDHYILKSFDPGKVSREIPLNRHPPEIIIGLGFFRSNPSYAALLPVRHFYAGTVRIL